MVGPGRPSAGPRPGHADGRGFDTEVSPFGAFEGAPTTAHWEAMAELVGPGATVALVAVDEGLVRAPPGWTVTWESAGVQMVADAGLAGRGRAAWDLPTDPVVSLGVDDVPEMLALVAEARPGPFSTRTVEFGGYVGIRRVSRLVAMAGERLRPPGYAEVSAVATQPGHRGQGLAELLVRSVASTIVARGEVPFLHAAAGNENAIRLYESLGFAIRRRVWFSVVSAPE